jgi:hypothetical protein
MKFNALAFIHTIGLAANIAAATKVTVVHSKPGFYLCPQCCRRRARPCHCTYYASVQDDGLSNSGCRCACSYHGPHIDGDGPGDFEPAPDYILCIPDKPNIA